MHTTLIPQIMKSIQKKSLLKNSFLLGAVLSVFHLSACNILEVENPNSLTEENLQNPAAAPSLANGAEATLTNALGSLLASYSTVTDELTWIGTRDGWLLLDQGETTDPINEFIDSAYRSVSEARWTADNTIQRLETFRDEGTLQNATPLVRSYLYGAVIYLSITDAFDNFVISDRQDAGSPVGEENLAQLIDTAIEYLNRGIELADDGSEWKTRLLAVRSRAHYSKALWEKLNPEINLDNPFVQSIEAAEDAEEALARIGLQNDWRYDLLVGPETPSNSLAFQVNERLELRIGNTYAQPTPDNTRAESVDVYDPLDNIPAPYLEQEIDAFVAANQYADIPVISARELHLIIAENAIAANNNGAFSTAINHLRNLDGLSSYSGQTDAAELLKHSRQVNLFLRGRRLADLYRFQEDSPEWATARVTRGAFFPITISEINSNPNVNF